MAGNPIFSPNASADRPGLVWDGPLIRRIVQSPGPTGATPPASPARPDPELGSAGWLAAKGNRIFANKVQAAQGQLKLSDLYTVTDDGFWIDHPMGTYTADNGHYYLAINPIGRLGGTTPAQVLERVGVHINQLFPWGGCSGGGGRSLRVGVHLRLTYWWLRWSSNVRVVYRGPWFFVLRTMRVHPLDGIAIHGVFQDTSPGAGGKYWMFQEGFGSKRQPDKILHIGHYDITINEGKPLLDQLGDTNFNYWAARKMWKQFAQKTRDFLGARN